MELDLTNKNCYHCTFFYKRPGIGNYFIYKCKYWGLESKGILPQSIVISSIGKKCPFFVRKKNDKKSEEMNKDNDGFDIIA